MKIGYFVMEDLSVVMKNFLHGSEFRIAWSARSVLECMFLLAGKSVPKLFLFDCGLRVEGRHLNNLISYANGRGCRVVALGDFQLPDEYRLRRWGVSGVLPRTLRREEIIFCLTQVAEGRICINVGSSGASTEKIRGNFEITLTRQEMNVIDLLAKGMSNKEIAGILNLSEGTVKVYLSRLYRKTGAPGRLALAIIALGVHSYPFNPVNGQGPPGGLKAFSSGSAIGFGGLPEGKLMHRVQPLER